MGKSRARLSRRPSSKSRTKRVIALKRTLANKQTNKPLGHMIIDQSVLSSSLIDMDAMWENTFEQPTHTPLGKTQRNNITLTSPVDDVKEHSEHLQNAWGTDEEFQSIMSEELHVEAVAPENKISGNRIVHLNHLLGTTIRISEQHARSCTAGNLYIDKETRCGLVSTLVYKCNTCEKTFSCTTEDPSAPIINKAAVWGTLSTGSTFHHTKEFLSVLNIPSLSGTMFYTIHEELSKVWAESSVNNMKIAGEEEKRLAIENGQIDEDGIPWICVYLDGGWAKRSYGHNYNSASGVGVIIGKATKKVLFLGVRNKFCIVCTRATNKNVPPAPHTCFKNWNASSASMEADIIVQGFSISEEMHGVRYKQFIADGDSSVYLKIQEQVPYGKQVTKIECTNHIIKNYGKRLHQFKSDTRNVSLAARKLLSTIVIRDLQKIAQKAIYDNAHGDIGALIEDLNAGPLHVFEHHTHCKDYFCTNVGDISNSKMVAVRSSGLYRLIQGSLSVVVRKSNCLIDNETNNRAELFMSILTRFTMGKRLNLIQRGSFKTRSELTTMRYNNGFLWHKSPWKRTMKYSPGKYMKKFMESQTKYKKKLTFKRQKRKGRYIETASKRNLDYGPNASQPELSVDAMNDACNEFLETLKVDAASQLQIMSLTVGQFDNPQYRSERAYRLTASTFGVVCKRREHTPCHTLVKNILSSSHFTSEAIEFGKMHEHVAISILEEKLNEKVLSSGLCVDIEYPFLGASPDGLVGQDRIVEVKCLFKVSKEKVNLLEAAQTLNICLEWKDNQLSLKRNHNYFFQVQGQLHISNREMCYFVVFVNQNEMFVEEIKKDDNFWKTQMEPKLVRFYKECVLPEIIRGNLKRGLKCVDPEYIMNAQKYNGNTKCKTLASI